MTILIAADDDDDSQSSGGRSASGSDMEGSGGMLSPPPEPVSTSKSPAPQNSGKQSPKAEKGAKGKKGNPTPEAVEDQRPFGEEDGMDPLNKDKVIPSVIHLSRDILTSMSPYLSLIQFASTMKLGESSTLMIEDNNYDNLNGDIVDFAFGAGTVEYLCLTGLGKPEKGCKAQRYGQILTVLSAMIDREAEQDKKEAMEEEWMNQ